MATLFYLNKSAKNVSHRPTPSTSSRSSSSRQVSRRESVDELQLDFGKDGVVTEMLRNISRREGLSKGRRLSYLNAFVKFLQNNGGGKGKQRDGHSTHDIFLCLRVCLIHEATVIRLATLRAIRYLLNTEEDLIAMNETGVPYLIVRCLDVVLNNSAERLQATRLCQRLLAIPNGAQHFPTTITRALVAIGFDGCAEQDKLHRGSLSLLCQLALLNPMQFIECGGVRVLLQNILGCTSPMVLEAMIGSLLHLLNVPETRDASGVNLQSLVAPFTDVHFKYGPNEPSEKDLDEREVGYQCSKIAIGVVLRSWSGIAHFCQSRNSGLQALVDALYIEQLEIRRTILDLICEILGVKFPTWSDEVSVALSAVDPSSPQDSWKLSEGFIVEETLSVLPHLAVSTPNITANHMALIVLSFIQRGLLEALVEVIVTGDTFISVRGTVLLGQLLHLVDKFIPLHCYDPTHCIPSLINYSAGESDSSSFSFLPGGRHQHQQRAMEALSVLSTLQKIKAKPPIPNSLFLQAQLEYAGYQPKAQGRFINKLGQVQVTRLLKRDIEANPNKLLKDTGVLNSKDSTTWQWDTILSLIKWAPSVLKRVDDSQWLNFLKRLIDYFKPSSNLFARLELGKGQSKLISKTAAALVTFLAEEVENFSGSVLLEGLLVDIAVQLDEIIRQPHNSCAWFLSPQKLENTLSQVYFLLVGKLTHTSKGFSVLEKGEILKRFYNLVCQVQHTCYVKLIVASLSYREEYCKRILSAALSCQFDDSRHFATQFLRVLVRTKLSGFSKWGMELLVNQLGDKNRAISLTAMSILEEAIHNKMFLESLIALRPTLTHLGDRGLLLLVTFLSLPSGFKFLKEANWLRNEIIKWRSSFNKRYVELVEVLVRDSVSTLRRGEDGKYPERASRNQEQSKFVDIYVPPHLYGQLAQHKEGLELLLDCGDINSLMATVNAQRATNGEETRELKAALWALCHFATSVDSVPLLEEGRVIESMVELGRFCPILSVRHTVFHCLCLICVTVVGSEMLRKWGWHAMPRSHHETFTIWSPEMFVNEETKRLLRLRVEEELLPEEDIPRGDEQDNYNEDDYVVEEEEEQEEEKGSIADTCSAQLNEEDESEELLLMEDMEEGSIRGSGSGGGGVGQQEMKACSLTTTTSSSPLRWSHAHHRSHSDSHTLSQGSSQGRRPRINRGGGGNGKSSTKPLLPPLSDSGVSGSGPLLGGPSNYWRWRKDSATESTTSGVSSCDSVLQQQQMLGHTLSPIPSSASIATTSGELPNSPPSRGSSRATLTEPVAGSSVGSAGRWGSPLHRSLRIRKPIIRMPSYSMTGGDHLDYGSFANRRPSGSSLMMLKTGSLDRNMILSPGDLFESNKIMRVNSSLTSLSTPSFRVRPEAEMKGPCYMGLCVPDDFGAIFLTDSSIPLHVRMQSSDEDQSNKEPNLGDSFEFHTPTTCLGCYRLKDHPTHEILDDPITEPKTCQQQSDTSFAPEITSLSSDVGSVEGWTEGAEGDGNAGSILLRKEILRLVSNLISCVGAKANEQGLLRLKQKFPVAFQDLCLYTELCVIMSKYNLRLILRRFLQELFFDNIFSEFYEVAELILGYEVEEPELEEEGVIEEEIT